MKTTCVVVYVVVILLLIYYYVFNTFDIIEREGRPNLERDGNGMLKQKTINAKTGSFSGWNKNSWVISLKLFSN